METMQYHLLGYLQVTRNGESCTPTAPMQRTLLAVLLLHRNEYITTRAIIGALWPNCPPRSAAAALQTYVSALRRRLTPSAGPPTDVHRHPVLRTESYGYVMSVEDGQLDLARFRTLADRARARLAAGRCGEAHQLFSTALGLWRGAAALADLRHNDTLDQQAVRLEQERLAVVQERLWLDLRHGRGPQVVGEIEQLCRSYPLRESLQHLLMVALALTGRRADALAVYARTYRVMVDEAGIEPGAHLRAAQHVLLADRDESTYTRLLADQYPGGVCACGLEVAEPDLLA